MVDNDFLFEHHGIDVTAAPDKLSGVVANYTGLKHRKKATIKHYILHNKKKRRKKRRERQIRRQTRTENQKPSNLTFHIYSSDFANNQQGKSVK